MENFWRPYINFFRQNGRGIETQNYNLLYQEGNKKVVDRAVGLIDMDFIHTTLELK